MASEIPVDIRLTLKGQELQNQLDQLLKGKSYDLNFSFNKLEEQLTNFPLTIKNIAIDPASISNLKLQIQNLFNDTPINVKLNVQQAQAQAQVAAKAVSQSISQAVDDSLSSITERIINDRINAYNQQVNQARAYGTENWQGQGGITGGTKVSGAGAGFADMMNGGKIYNTASSMNQAINGPNNFNPAQMRAAEMLRMLQARGVGSGSYVPLGQVQGELQIYNAIQQAQAAAADYDQTINALDSYYRKTAPFSQFMTSNQYQRSQSSGGPAYDAMFKDLESFRASQYSGPYDAMFQDYAQQKASDDYARRTASFSSLSDRPRSFTERLNSTGVRRAIGQSALFGAIHGDISQLLGGTIGSAIGGGLGDEFGAQIGGAAGIGIVSNVVKGFEQLTSTLIEAAQAGLTFQRSILGISGILSQSSQFVSEDGTPVGVADQVRLQKARATKIQLAARQQAAAVGIGGEAESSLVQAILTGFGTRGIELNEGQAAAVTARLGAALNIFAPELANQPNVVRRDIFDITRGVGQASRTALGSRVPQVIEQLRTAQTGEDVVKATESLENLIKVFQNSGDAITQIQRLTAIADIIKTNFGESIVNELGEGIKELVDSLNSPEVTTALRTLGSEIGGVTNQAIRALAALTQSIASFANGIKPEKAVAFAAVGPLAYVPGVSDFFKNATGGRPQDSLSVIGSLLGGTAIGGVGGGFLGGGIGAVGGALAGIPLGPAGILAGALTGGIAGATTGFGAGGLAGATAGFGLGAFNLFDKDQKAQEFANNLGYQQKFNPVKAQQLFSTKITENLRRGGLSEDQINTTLYGLAEQNPEFKLAQLQSGANTSRSLLSSGLFKNETNLSEDVLRGHIVASNRGQINILSALDRGGINNSTTLASQVENLRGSNVGQRVNLAQENLNIAKQANDGSLAGIAAVAQAERELAAQRKQSYDITNQLAQVENQRDRNRAASIQRVSLSGQRLGLEADIGTIQNEMRREQDPEKAAALQGELIQKQAQQELTGKGETPGPQQIVDQANAGKAFIDAAVNLANFSDKAKLASMSLDDFSNDLKIATLSGKDKIAAQAKRNLQKGIDLTPSQSLQLADLGLYDAVFGEDGLETEFRDRDLGQAQLDSLLSAQKKITPEFNIEYRKRYGEVLKQPFEGAAAEGQFGVAAIKYGQLVSPTGLTGGVDIKGLNDSLKGLVGSLNDLIKGFSVENLSQAVSSAIAAQFPPSN